MFLKSYLNDRKLVFNNSYKCHSMTFVHTLRVMKFQKKIFNLQYKPTMYKRAKVPCSITSVVKQKKKRSSNKYGNATKQTKVNREGLNKCY